MFTHELYTVEKFIASFQDLGELFAGTGPLTKGAVFASYVLAAALYLALAYPVIAPACRRAFRSLRAAIELGVVGLLLVAMLGASIVLMENLHGLDRWTAAFYALLASPVLGCVTALAFVTVRPLITPSRPRRRRTTGRRTTKVAVSTAA